MVRATPWSHETEFSAEVESIPKARHFVCTHLIGHRLLYLVEDVRLVVSELATNAVRHANTPFAVTLEQVDQSVVVTVTDGSPAAPVRLAKDVLDTSGRGLSIVDLVSRDWGVTQRPGEAKSVWASFALRADRDPNRIAVSAESGGAGPGSDHGRVNEQTMPWRNTTHDWASAVDARHLSEIREHPALFAPSGVLHLVLEVLAYAADEATYTPDARGTVTLHLDGSLSVADNGRGTDTRYDAEGSPVKKPVMATKDLHFFDFPDAEALLDGHPRRGMSVVAALSEWLVHTNRRMNGAWTQRYERGIPVTGLVPVEDDTTTGTLVRFMPDVAVRGTSPAPTSSDLRRLARRLPLSVEVIDETTA